MPSQHFCHYLKDRNSKRGRNANLEHASLSFHERKEPYGLWGVIIYREYFLKTNHDSILITIAPKGEARAKPSEDRLTREGKAYWALVDKYISAKAPVAENRKNSVGIPKHAYQFLKKYTDEKGYCTLPSKWEKTTSFPPRAIRDVSQERGIYRYDTNDSRFLSEILKNDSHNKTDWGTWGTYYSSYVIDAKVIDEEIGVVLRGHNKWEDSGGGIGMSWSATAQYQGKIYCTDEVKYRDQWKQSEDRLYRQVDNIVNAKIMNGTPWLCFGDTDGKVRWESTHAK